MPLLSQGVRSLTVVLIALIAMYWNGASAGELVIEAEMGLGGVWKVGYPTRVLVKVQSGSVAHEGRIEFQTYDGDGVAVIYQSDAWRFKLEADMVARIEAVIKNGRGNRPITIRIIDDQGKQIYERQLSETERGVAIPATQPWIVGIGSEGLNLSQASKKSARGALPEYTTVHLHEIEQLPTSSLGFEGVDLMVISSSNTKLNGSLDESRIQAISDWLGRGGRCLMSLGTNAASLVQQSSFANLIPGTLREISMRCDPGPLESYVGSQAPYSALHCANFAFSGGNVDLPSLTNLREKFPMLAKWTYGSGKISFIATELDSPEMIAWESRPALLKLLYEDHWEKKNITTDKLAYQGYDDISGQLNATLDFFPSLVLGNLTSISIIAGLLCLIIGPFDYFVISRAWRRPRATWITLIVCSLGSCMIVAGLTRTWKPDTTSMNSMELIDIDYQTQKLVGRGFGRCYGGLRGEFDFSVHRRSKSLNSEMISTMPLRLDWIGQPGKGLGGFDSTVATDRGMPVYRITYGQAEKTPSGERMSGALPLQGIQGVGIPFAGTKGMGVIWEEPISIPSSAHSLSVVVGPIDYLEGSWANSLGVDLLDAFLIYRGRGYTLPTRIRENETISFSANTIPKDITRRLQRRQNVAGQEKSTPWNPGDTSSLDRLVELISFHRSVTGSNYTGLYNRYLSTLDVSDVVRQDRAILFAEMKESNLTWSIRRNSLPIQADETSRKTYVRLIIPVTRPK